MSRFWSAALLVPALLSPARADRIAPPSIAMQLASAPVAVVGKVTSLEPKIIKAERFPGDKEMGEYRVAVVKIEDALLGAKGLTHIKVGFIPVAGVGVGRDGYLRNLDKDMRVLLFLTPHAGGSFHIGKDYFSMTAKRDGDAFDAQVAEAKRCAKLLADPVAGLKSKEVEDRFQAAFLLVSRYRVKPSEKAKAVEIPAEQSELILKALAEVDWMPKPGRDFRLSPQQMFFALNLTKEDGWEQPKDFQKLEADAKKWLKEKGGKYRIKRWVAE